MEQENLRLKEQVNTLKQYVDTLMMDSSMYMEELRSKGKGKAKPWKVTEKRIWRAAKNIYYKELKEDKTLLADITKKVQSIGLIGPDNKCVPLHIVRSYTDQMFSSLPHDSKMGYRQQAEKMYQV
jgi:hypothetical protein